MKRTAILHVTALTCLMCLAHEALAAELFKCRLKQGRTLYSDTECEKSGATQVGKVKVPQLESQAPQSRNDGGRSNLWQPAASGTKSAPKDPEARRTREAELKAVLESRGSTLEQKAAAQEELSSLGNGVCKLKDDERARWDTAFADLAGDRAARPKARTALREMLRSCERI